MAAPKPPGTVMLKLTLDRSLDKFAFPNRLIKLQLGGPGVTVGRTSKRDRNLVSSSSNGYFDSSVMSRHHAILSADISSKVFIMDTGSLHGTFLNGLQLPRDQRRHIRSGDTIQFGAAISRGPENFAPCMARVTIDDASSSSSQDRSNQPFVIRVPDDDADDEIDSDSSSESVAEAVEMLKKNGFKGPSAPPSRVGVQHHEVIDLTDDQAAPDQAAARPPCAAWRVSPSVIPAPVPVAAPAPAPLTAFITVSVTDLGQQQQQPQEPAQLASVFVEASVESFSPSPPQPERTDLIFLGTVPGMRVDDSEAATAAGTATGTTIDAVAVAVADPEANLDMPRLGHGEKSADQMEIEDSDGEGVRGQDSDNVCRIVEAGQKEDAHGTDQSLGGRSLVADSEDEDVGMSSGDDDDDDDDDVADDDDDVADDDSDDFSFEDVSDDELGAEIDHDLDQELGAAGPASSNLSSDDPSSDHHMSGTDLPALAPTTSLAEEEKMDKDDDSGEKEASGGEKVVACERQDVEMATEDEASEEAAPSDLDGQPGVDSSQRLGMPLADVPVVVPAEADAPNTEPPNVDPEPKSDAIQPNGLKVDQHHVDEAHNTEGHKIGGPKVDGPRLDAEKTAEYGTGPYLYARLPPMSESAGTMAASRPVFNGPYPGPASPSHASIGHGTIPHTYAKTDRLAEFERIMLATRAQSNGPYLGPGKLPSMPQQQWANQVSRPYLTLANTGLANPTFANPGSANPGSASPGPANPDFASPGPANPGPASPATATLPASMTGPCRHMEYNKLAYWAAREQNKLTLAQIRAGEDVSKLSPLPPFQPLPPLKPVPGCTNLPSLIGLRRAEMGPAYPSPPVGNPANFLPSPYMPRDLQPAPATGPQGTAASPPDVPPQESKVSQATSGPADPQPAEGLQGTNGQAETQPAKAPGLQQFVDHQRRVAFTCSRIWANRVLTAELEKQTREMERLSKSWRGLMTSTGATGDVTKPGVAAGPAESPQAPSRPALSLSQMTQQSNPTDSIMEPQPGRDAEEGASPQPVVAVNTSCKQDTGVDAPAVAAPLLPTRSASPSAKKRKADEISDMAEAEREPEPEVKIGAQPAGVTAQIEAGKEADQPKRKRLRRLADIFSFGMFGGVITGVALFSTLSATAPNF